MTYQAALQKIEQAKAEQWEELDLAGMGLTELPPEIGQLGQLKRLILGRWDNELEEVLGNQLRTLPPELWQLHQLEHLSLSSNKISTIPEAITQLVNLQRLDLRSNQIRVIPESIAQLVNLQRLDLSRNQIRVISESIAQLVNLQTFYLSRNQIRVIPESIAQLTNLQRLYLSINQICVIPEAISQLINLQSLDLSINQIRFIPESIAQLTNLKVLRLSANQIIAIPRIIAKLVNLQTICLSFNHISTIPESIGELINLKTLELWSNRIKVIPESIGKLLNLKILLLSANKLSVIPESIAYLVNLEGLSLSENQITVLPKSITALIKLKVLDIKENPISIPSEVLDSEMAKLILDYYFTTRDPNQTQILYEAKLLLVGEGRAGKTSLANKLLNPNYELKPTTEDTSTEGIDIIDWEFIGTNGKPYKIHIWDFGGQEIYHQTHQFFLTERACYLLVADDRKENTDHYFWLQSIQLLSKNSPVHLIQNEKGDRGCTLNLKQLRGEFANLRDTHRTNLADNRGLPELQTALQREIEALIPHGIPFPNKWLAVRYTLENDSRNYIDYAEYETICRRHEISDRAEMHNLSRFLHDLGIVLHFQTDPILRQRLILKPNWGTIAIYKILDNPTVKANLGQFSDSDLETIWADSQYADMHHELLQLMKEFKVCYEVPNHGPRRKGQYIAPHLLSPDTPAYSPLPTANSLILRYRYTNFMPKGILTRFIVEMHRDIENGSDPANTAVWKTGVILTNGAARAEIIEYYNQREIHIRVSGNRPRDFLTIINRKLEEINDDFYDDANFTENPPYEILIPCNCPTCKPTPEPYTFPLNLLHDWIDEGRYEIQCYRKGANVNIRSLIDGVIVENFRDSEDSPAEFSGKSRYDRATRRRRKLNSEPAVTPVIIENHIHNTSQQEQTVTNDKNYTWNGDKVAGNKMQIGTVHGDAVAGNKIINSQNLAQAAQDIKALITQLSTDYDTTTPTGKRKLSDRILETLEGDSTIQNRALNALKEAGKTAFEEAIDHPVAKVLVAGLEGYLEG